ncbi:family 16 glycoside hydrolase [Aerosakkonemataceae cyanobacterium BLCC-F50]|uniref:Family 16 glycoside hydrolase n=1 Tax=Floridaenema flaviceps BLCC-F50 TaxID=3153642 RepID=A0ABV4Y360_9CYAN
MTLNRLVDSGQQLPTPDVQRTTFAMDAMARYVCNTWEEILAAQAGGEFDVVIIGSGMYGAYCAAKLFEFGEELAQQDKPRILVLESGPFLISEHIQNLTRLGNFFNVVNETLVEDSQKNIVELDSYSNHHNFNKHHRCVGGKSLFWGGWTPRLLEEDLQQWPAEVKDYLLLKDKADGYEFIEREIGAKPAADFINGELFDILKGLSKDVLQYKSDRIPLLKEVLDPPIAVTGQSPGSGLFSMDKFSSLPLLLDSIRRDNDNSNSNNQNRRLFLVPNIEVLKLETVNGVVTQIVGAIKDPLDPNNKSLARVVRLNLSPRAIVAIAGNTINSTRLALNSFPRPQQLAPNSELMGRNLMVHVRGNFIWKATRDALGVPNQLDNELQTAALHVRGTTETQNGPGQFHFQFYAAPSLNDPAFPGAQGNAEEFLYRMIPNLDEYYRILTAQTKGTMEGKVVLSIRTCGETFGDKTSPIGTNNVSWVGVNTFGGTGDDVYTNGENLRVPKVFVNLVETPADKEVRVAQAQAAFAFIETLSNQPPGSATQTNPNAPIQFLNTEGGEDGLGTTYHESGTLWMGTDYTQSVTDVNGRFHHVSNAYCVDQAIFTTVGSANPVPTGLALSRKIARSIIERYTEVANVSDEPGFETIYQGNFKADGWEIAASGSQNFFDVQNQSIPVLGAGVADKNVGLGVLWFTRKKYKNFILKLEWKAFEIEANSGIFLRTPEPKVLDDSFYNSSTEIQIDDRGYDFGNNIYGSPLHKTGSVYEVFPAQKWAAKVISHRNSGKSGYWNSYEIKVQNNQIEVKLNGHLVSAGTFPELLEFAAPSDGKKKRSEGFIGLQCHTEVVQFRNIRIKEL